MPLRRSRIHSAELLAYDDGIASLDLVVGSGTYVRAIADVLGGHCRMLRRTEVGPFGVEDADEERILAPREALPFLPLVEVGAEEAQAIRTGRTRRVEPVRVVHAGELVAVDGTVLPA
jgi:tRNA U55 pseudouridine synthase TruB